MNRSHSINHELKEIYVLPHLYGELARHRFGINLINEQGLLSDAVKTVLAGNTETMFDVSQLKAALWALGHIGSTVAGTQPFQILSSLNRYSKIFTRRRSKGV